MLKQRANLGATVRLTKRNAFPQFCLIALFAVSSAYAQQDVIPPDAAPPPLKLLSKTEKQQLAGAKDVKERTKLSLQLMDARVKIAEQYLPQEQLEMVF